jgi:hypothetical protein
MPAHENENIRTAAFDLSNMARSCRWKWDAAFAQRRKSNAWAIRSAAADRRDPTPRVWSAPSDRLHGLIADRTDRPTGFTEDRDRSDHHPVKSVEKILNLSVLSKVSGNNELGDLFKAGQYP